MEKKGHSLLVCQSLIRTIIPHLSVTFYSRLFYIHFLGFFPSSIIQAWSVSSVPDTVLTLYYFKAPASIILCEDNLAHWLTLSPLHYWNVGGVGLTMFMQ